MRVLAIVLLFAVLPSMELVEQVAHVVEHVLHGEVPSHDAHHDQQPGDEHGCTGLVHLCPCHQGQVTPTIIPHVRTIENMNVVALALPVPLHDKNALEPPHRPPIG